MNNLHTTVKRPTVRQIKLGQNEGWGGFELSHGYGVFQSIDGMYSIERIDAMGTFNCDEEASRAAAEDGLPIIPENELPEAFEFRWFGWIDTPENRQRIHEHANGVRSKDGNGKEAAASAEAYVAKYCPATARKRGAAVKAL